VPPRLLGEIHQPTYGPHRGCGGWPAQAGHAQAAPASPRKRGRGERMNAMLDETRSYHDPSHRLEEAILDYLECRERGGEPQLPQGLLHDPEALAALNELIEDERELEPWFGPLRPVTQPEVGRLFGNYELIKLLGVGGQGVVYRARQVHINKEVALKL